MEIIKTVPDLHARTSEVFPVRLDYSMGKRDAETWDEMFAYAEEQFGPDAVTQIRIADQDRDGFALDPNARWTWNNFGVLYFKTLTDATLFKLRWC